MLQEILRHNQKGFCKFGGGFFKYHENEECLDRNCRHNECTKRHPKVCRYFAQYKFGKFGSDCAFVHEKIVKMNDFMLALEDVKNVKAEVDVLKNTFNSLTSIKQEGNVLKRLIEGLKVETQKLRKENEEIKHRIKHVEEEFEDETEEESEIESHVPLEGLFSCMYCDHQFGIRKYFEAHMMIHQDKYNSNLDIKCSVCDYNCTQEITMKKHMNTIHPGLSDKSEEKNIPVDNSEGNVKNNNKKYEDYLEDVDDFFQI